MHVSGAIFGSNYYDSLLQICFYVCNCENACFYKYIACKASKTMKTSGCQKLGGSFHIENFEIPDRGHGLTQRNHMLKMSCFPQTWYFDRQF